MSAFNLNQDLTHTIQKKPNVFGDALHQGVVLEKSSIGFDSNSSTFASIFYDQNMSKEFYLFYTGDFQRILYAFKYRFGDFA